MGKHLPDQNEPNARHLSTPADAEQARTRRARPAAGLTVHAPVDDPVVTARTLTKVYGRGEGSVTALDAVDVSIARNQFTAIMGPSGSGKSTLLHCLTGLESATSGTIVLDGEEITSMSSRRLTRLRRERIGFVFQTFNLVPSLTAEENITLPLTIAHRPVNPEQLDRIAQYVGLTGRLGHRPAELSGGQIQRVACARALIGGPAVIFADEPTGNLDSHSTDQVLEVLRTSVDRLRQSVVMVTHEPDAAAWADTVLFLRDGHLVAEMHQPDRLRILDALAELRSTSGAQIAVGVDERREIQEGWAQPRPQPPTTPPPPAVGAGVGTSADTRRTERGTRPPGGNTPWGVGR